jgi:methyltransferase (TIGR00027 family)
MFPNGGEITHVSDTALMVAACRALETEAEDAWIADPFAARLAGERGMAILLAMPHSGMVRFGLAARTRFVDELLLEALGQHRVATVLSVGCGLDTRPWRLDLNPDLRWIEIDFRDVLDYKDGVMANETPRCRRQRFAADLNDPAQRRSLYRVTGSEPALMITEGLLMYLPAATMEALAAESWNQSGIAHWIADITTTEFGIAIGGGDWMRSIRHVQAADSLKGERIIEVVNRHGWRTASMRSYISDMGFAADRVRRMMGGAEPPKPHFPPNDPTGIHRLARI